MGTTAKAVCSYTLIFNGVFECKNCVTFCLQPLQYHRYVDDTLMIWHFGEDELDLFKYYMNTCSKHIKFTIESLKKETPFLDTLVKLEGNRAITNLYYKPITHTTTNGMTQLTCRAACHAEIQGAEYRHVFRVKRICTSLADFDHHEIA